VTPKVQIEVITYEQDRLNYFTDLMKKAQERYKRLFKKFKDAPYASEEAQALSDAGRETHFLGDVVGMLEVVDAKIATPTSEWISVEDRLPDKYGDVICCTRRGSIMQVTYNPTYKLFNVSCDNVEDAIYVTHWMPMPLQPEMEGGE